MSIEGKGPSVLLLGATGRTGGRVLRQLLATGVPVRALVRSAGRLPAAIQADPLLTVVEAEVASMSAEDFRHQVDGCNVVISCLGHASSLSGVYGPPRDLVERTVRATREAAEVLEPEVPLRLILMSSVSVNRPQRLDSRRGAGERAFVWLIRAVVPPARDNQRAADHLASEVGDEHAFLSWVVVRPDTLVEGDVSAYTAHDGLVAGLFQPDETCMANVAHFMAELVTDDTVWRRWQGHMPVIVNAEVADTEAGAAAAALAAP